MKKTVKIDSSPNDSLFTPLPERRTYKEIANQIRQLIYSRTLKPGDKLPSENKLALQFRVGRISVREALRTLEQAGLIFIKQGNTGGSFVKEVDPSVAAQSMSDLVWQGDINLSDLTEARLDIEKLILERAFDRITQDELEAIDKWIQELETLIAEGQENDYPIEPTLTNFHIMLAHATKNPVFPIVLRALMDVTRRVIRVRTISVDRLKKHISFYRSVHQALKSRDFAVALQKLNEHMIAVKEQYLRRSSYKDKNRT